MTERSTDDFVMVHRTVIESMVSDLLELEDAVASSDEGFNKFVRDGYRKAFDKLQPSIDDFNQKYSNKDDKECNL